MPCLAEGNEEFHKALVDPDWECGYALCSTDLIAKPTPWILSSDGQFPLPEECIATSFFSQRAIISESSFIRSAMSMRHPWGLLGYKCSSRLGDGSCRMLTALGATGEN